LLLYQIALTLIPGIGDITAKKLIAYCGSAEAVFKEKKKNFEKIPGIGETLAGAIANQNVLKHAEDELKFIEKYKIKTFYFLDANYPARLKQCVDSPVMLYFKGDANMNVEKVIAIVGTRSASDYGKGFTNQLIVDLTEQQVLVVSGLAYGIDTAAHKAALKNNLPTIAVLAHGLDRIYPPLNKTLAEQMVKNGGLLTDFISQTNPDRENFPKRNRIIAGMSDAVVVVEAGRKGGALITADIANSYNRDVFAVPGRLGDTYSEGCNNLIKTNRAALIQSADDIKYIMGWEKQTASEKLRQRELFIQLTPDEELIINILKENGVTGIDTICSESRLSPSKVASVLLNLEFEQIVKCLPGKIYNLV